MSEKDKLISMLQDHPVIKRYQTIEKVINENQTVKKKIQELKGIQKQLVNAKEIGKQRAVDAYQKRYDELYLEIENVPLMLEYLALQSDINEVLQEIQDIVEQGIEADFNQ
mgnify:CR=1 FL=1